MCIIVSHCTYTCVYTVLEGSQVPSQRVKSAEVAVSTQRSVRLDQGWCSRCSRNVTTVGGQVTSSEKRTAVRNARERGLNKHLSGGGGWSLAH